MHHAPGSWPSLRGAPDRLWKVVRIRNSFLLAPARGDGYSTAGPAERKRILGEPTSPPDRTAALPPRQPSVHHATSHPYRFVGRDAELALLDESLAGGPASVVALIGPGGQGKTAIVQHWLESFAAGTRRADG